MGINKTNETLLKNKHGPFDTGKKWKSVDPKARLMVENLGVCTVMGKFK